MSNLKKETLLEAAKAVLRSHSNGSDWGQIHAAGSRLRDAIAIEEEKAPQPPDWCIEMVHARAQQAEADLKWWKNHAEELRVKLRNAMLGLEKPHTATDVRIAALDRENRSLRSSLEHAHRLNAELSIRPSIQVSSTEMAMRVGTLQDEVQRLTYRNSELAKKLDRYAGMQMDTVVIDTSHEWKQRAEKAESERDLAKNQTTLAVERLERQSGELYTLRGCIEDSFSVRTGAPVMDLVGAVGKFIRESVGEFEKLGYKAPMRLSTVIPSVVAELLDRRKLHKERYDSILVTRKKVFDAFAELADK